VEKTDPIHIGFFLDLFNQIFQQEITLGDEYNSEILCESVFQTSSKLTRGWKYTFLFSGENRLVDHWRDYMVILSARPTGGLFVTCPLFVVYAYCRNQVALLESLGREQNQERDKLSVAVPPQDVLVTISNPNSPSRNELLDQLEKSLKKESINITYGGSYKNNTGGRFPGLYDTSEFLDYLRQFKFVLTLENGSGEHYITEKIVNAFLAGTIPVYWGSPRVNRYFNSQRFIHFSDGSKETVQNVTQQIVNLKEHPDQWLTMAAQPVFPDPNRGLFPKMNFLVEEIRHLLKLSPAVIYPVTNVDVGATFAGETGSRGRGSFLGDRLIEPVGRVLGTEFVQQSHRTACRVCVLIFGCAVIPRYQQQIDVLLDSWGVMADRLGIPFYIFVGQSIPAYQNNPHVVALASRGVKDDHQSAAFKQYVGLQWILAHHEPDFVFIAGSDIYLDCHNLLQVVSQFDPVAPFYIGDDSFFNDIFNLNFRFHDGGPGVILSKGALNVMSPYLYQFQERWNQLIDEWYPAWPHYKDACDLSVGLLSLYLKIISVRVFGGFSPRCRSNSETPWRLVSCHGGMG